MRPNRAARRKKVAVFFQNFRENKRLHRAIHVFQRDERHGRAGARHLLFHAFHNGQNVHILLVFILVGFPGGAAGNLIKARGDAGVIDLRIRRHGVPGKVHAGDFLFHRKQFGFGELLGFRHLERFRFLLPAKVKQADLSLYVAAFVVLQLIEQRADRHQHFAAVVAETVECTAADKTFHGTAVQVSALHALAEIVEGHERAVHRALG